MRKGIITTLVLGLLALPVDLRSQELSFKFLDRSWTEDAVLGAFGVLFGLLYVSKLSSRPEVVDEVVFIPHQPARLPGDGAVHLFVDSTTTRTEIEALLAKYDVLARSRVTDRSGSADANWRSRARLQRRAQWVRRLGGDALLVTRRSELVGVLMQDARYAGAIDETVWYALRRRVP